ncbi:hypothetical protein BV22DRAFT_1031122 [Leucogyrophana mollusca]|uniref:Uncharacterized protein n=1 Tax=Leucogyrophana mollusca TaxID=85980 RepID=A0ACB8BSU0_9AGAM|nr:hypothetical protein BV22DRAFT_1031122 [Leucogyrophana mollusca]
MLLVSGVDLLWTHAAQAAALLTRDRTDKNPTGRKRWLSIVFKSRSLPSHWQFRVSEMPFSRLVDDVARHGNAYLVTSASLMGYVCYGWEIGMMGGVLALPSFQRYFGLDKVSVDARASLSGNIVSVLQAGGFFGSLSTTYLSVHFGRRTCLILSAVVYLIGCLIQCVAGIGSTQAVGLSVLYFGRFVGGLGIGLMSVITPNYLSECAPRAIRGRCTGGVELALTVGSMLCFWVNYGSSLNIPSGEMQWRTPFIVQMVPGVLLFVFMLFQPESPRWLVEKQRYDEAAQALSYIAKKPVDDAVVIATLGEIKADYSGKQKIPFLSQIRKMGESRTIALRCAIPSLLTCFQQLTGTNAINYYSPEIFAELGISSTTSSLFATGVYGIVKLCATVFAVVYAVETWGRKRCLIYGALGQGLMMLWIGGYVGIHPQSTIVPATYVSIVAVYLYGVFLCVGWGPVAYTVATEVAPNHVRTAAIAIAGAVMWLFTFIIAQITPIMLVHITYGTYLFFGMLCLIMASYVYVFLPETGGYALEDTGFLFEKGMVIRALEDAPGGRIFIGKKKSIPVAEMKRAHDVQRSSARGTSGGESTNRGLHEEKRCEERTDFVRTEGVI